MDNPTNMDVLIVDDAATMRQIVWKLLHEMGIENVREAEDGESAFKALERQKAGLVISDWHMPKMTGIELLRAIRANEALKDTPVLMVTGESSQKNIIEAMEAGASGYLIKPFDFEAFEKQINKLRK